MGKLKSIGLCALVWIWSVAVCSAVPLVWVTDDTPGGHYIINGGLSFAKDKPGIEVELYQMVAEKLNLDIRFERHPWTRCLYLLEQNRVDGIFPASFKPERMKIGAYPMEGSKVDTSRKTRDNAYYLYKLKNNSIDWDGKDFFHVSSGVGVPRGWAIVSDLQKRYSFIREETINEHTPNLLVHGRLQGFVCLETVFDAYLARNSKAYGDIVKVTPPVKEKPYYLMFSHEFVKTRPELAEQIWDTIGEIKQTQTYSRLVNSYL